MGSGPLSESSSDQGVTCEVFKGWKHPFAEWNAAIAYLLEVLVEIRSVEYCVQ